MVVNMNNYLTYLEDITENLSKKWPDNKTINIVCHGHSVPSGYFATPYVNTFDSYPHLLHKILKERFPYAVINVIVTGIGGENSQNGAKRFENEVLNHNPSLITIDYALNDRSIGLEEAEKSWREMIELALSKNMKVILMTPTWDNSYFKKNDSWNKLVQHSNLTTQLAKEYNIGLADSFACFAQYCIKESDLTQLLSHGNHPTKKGHELVANEIAKYFLAR